MVFAARSGPSTVSGAGRPRRRNASSGSCCAADGGPNSAGVTTLGHVRTVEQFQTMVETFDYETFKPYIEKMLAGEKNVASPGRVKLFARSSGTTSDRSKYIPVTEESAPGGTIRWACATWRRSFRATIRRPGFSKARR